MSESLRDRAVVCVSATLVLLGLVSTLWFYWTPIQPQACETNTLTIPNAHLQLASQIVVDDPHGTAQQFPNAVLLGFSHCDSGTVRKVLELHPDIRFLLNETGFWLENHFHRLKRGYLPFLPNSLDKQIVIEEISTYIKSKLMIFRMHRFFPNLKLMIVIRDPVVSWLSKLDHSTRSEHKNRTESKKTHSPCTYGDYGRYLQQLSLIFRVFNRDQILIVDSGTVKRDPFGFMKQVEAFLGLESNFPEGLLTTRSDRRKFCLNESHAMFSGLVEKLHLGQASFCVTEDPPVSFETVQKSCGLESESILNYGKEALFLGLGRRFDWKLS